MRRRKTWVSVALAAGMLAVSCGTETALPAPEDIDADVVVDLYEWGVDPSPETIEAGEVTFAARNTGRALHDLLVLRTDHPHDDLPTRGGRVDPDADGVELVGEIEPFRPGDVRELTVTLAPGSHVLVCNVGGHYRAGMHVPFEVT